MMSQQVMPLKIELEGNWQKFHKNSIHFFFLLLLQSYSCKVIIYANVRENGDCEDDMMFCFTSFSKLLPSEDLAEIVLGYK